MDATTIQPAIQPQNEQIEQHEKFQSQATVSATEYQQNRLSRSWRHYAFSPIIVNTLAELELLLLTFNIGIQDAATFSDYRCFASNQTGNTVMLALAVVAQNDTSDLFILANIGISLPLFLAGAFITGQLGNHVLGPRMRAWLVGINFLQTMMVFCAAVMQFTLGGQSEGPAALGIISLLAFSSGSQVVLSRVLQIPEITTAMATAAWVDLMIDPKVWKIRNRPRNRRSFFLLSLFAGSLVGAAVYYKAGSPIALILSASVKAIVTVMLFFNPSEPIVDYDDCALA
ncbi:hypothetical protein TMatcc_001290 [Talaromyces marneffei ATCC 18224]|uniref:DUF1275 domain protein n=2 Tax=Talaromyces marneffei TaxID=37727 RepID=B6QJC7_TALMQ|nr:uncharacterized protein EYB26_007472 [Talaromyces marneffei]EEA22442.1 DUF1275 domain protein [Talaromyces marneffei ATCC 18224]KAE8551346.1 hypothetical protein EYB25_005231 [Talaromyces marneffei]QGA19778.1 hypothetical protein EYB26_007472 [Talaromyces marneffei]